MYIYLHETSCPRIGVSTTLYLSFDGFDGVEELNCLSFIGVKERNVDGLFFSVLIS